MTNDVVRSGSLASIACEPRPHLPDGFRRSGPYHYEDPEEEWLLVVSGTPTLRQMFTSDGDDHIVVERRSGIDPTAPRCR